MLCMLSHFYSSIDIGCSKPFSLITSIERKVVVVVVAAVAAKRQRTRYYTLFLNHKQFYNIPVCVLFQSLLFRFLF